MDAPTQQDTAQGLSMAELQNELVTLAPNVGPPCAVVGGEDILRRDTWYASFDGPSHSALSTSRDFSPATSGGIQPVRGRYYGDDFSCGEHSRTTKNVTFRSRRRRKDKHREIISDSSDELSETDYSDEQADGSRGGAPLHTLSLIHI